MENKKKRWKLKLHCNATAYQSILQNPMARMYSIFEKQDRIPLKLAIEKNDVVTKDSA